MLEPDANKLACGFKEVEYEVKKSRFIARLERVASRDEAMNAVTSARHRYADARHHCWAYVILSGSSAAMSDDGEPSGTAGKPILNVIQHKNISEVVVVVSRYFGGIKLGAGGLVRAYASATQAVLDQVAVIEPVPTIDLKLCFDFALEQQVRHWIGLHQGQIQNLVYGEKVELVARVPADEELSFVASLQSVAVSFSLIE